MILKLSNGIVVSDQLIGNYKAGYNIVKSFPLTVQYEGEEYQINQSWLSPILRPSDQLYIQSKASNDPSLVQRNFKVYVGGVKMVASYKKLVALPPREKAQANVSILLILQTRSLLRKRHLWNRMRTGQF